MPAHIIIELMKTKDKILLKQQERNNTLPIEEKQFKQQQLSHQRIWKWKQYISSTERKELLTQNPIPSKNVLRNEGRNEDILRGKKTKNSCRQQIYSERIAQGSSLSRKEKRKNIERKTQQTKIQVHATDFSLLAQFPKLCMMVKQKL